MIAIKEISPNVLPAVHWGCCVIFANCKEKLTALLNTLCLQPAPEKAIMLFLKHAEQMTEQINSKKAQK